jgi:hypothetical protein
LVAITPGSGSTKYKVEYYMAKIYPLENASQNDTVIFGDFNAIEALKKCVLINQATGVEVTCSISYNVITITGAGSNMDLVAMVFGRIA